MDLLTYWVYINKNLILLSLIWSGAWIVVEVIKNIRMVEESKYKFFGIIKQSENKGGKGNE